MRNIKKIVVLVSLGILFVQNIFFGFAFAKDTESVQCKTCTMASPEFQTYVNFQVEMLQILQKAVRKDNERIDNKNVGLFSAKILSLPVKLVKSRITMFKKSGNDLVAGYRSFKMGMIMLTSITIDIVTKDAIGGLKILFRNKPFVREWKTLQELDASMHDAMRDLGMNGLWDDPISNDILNDISQLQKKYKKSAGNELGFFDVFDVSADAKYKDIIGMMLKLNAVMKTFMSTHSKAVTSNFFKSFLWRIDRDISRGGISMKFNIELMEKMFNSYKCAEGVSACNSMRKDFANNTKVWSQIKKGLTDSMTIIKKANASLAKAMLSMKSSVNDTFNGKDKNDELGLTEKQLALLRTVYGIDTTKLSKEQGIGLESLLNRTAGKKMMNDIGLKFRDYFAKSDKDLQTKAKQLADKEKEDNNFLSVLSASQAQQAEKEWADKLEQRERDARYDSRQLSSNMLNTLGVVLIQKQEDKKVVMIHSNLYITRYFVEIGALIHNIVENTLGTKDSNGLIHSLGETCEYQCSNKGTKNCYAK